MLLCFEEVYKLKINLGKSELVPVGTVPKVEALAQILGCKMSKVPLKYLGLPCLWVLDSNLVSFGIQYWRI